MPTQVLNLTPLFVVSFIEKSLSKVRLSHPPVKAAPACFANSLFVKVKSSLPNVNSRERVTLLVTSY